MATDPINSALVNKMLPFSGGSKSSHCVPIKDRRAERNYKLIIYVSPFLGGAPFHVYNKTILIMSHDRRVLLLWLRLMKAFNYSLRDD